MPGYHLHLDANLGTFPQSHGELFLSPSPLDEPVRVVVQNAGLGAWLKRALAQSQKTVMGMNILMPEMALRDFSSGYPSVRKLLGENPQRGLLFMDGMKLATLKAVEEILEGEDSLFAPIRAYLGEERGMRLWQFSDALAGIFYHYGMNCLELVECWDQGRAYPVPNERLGRAEEWQRALWQRIFHDQAPYVHLSRVLMEAMASDEPYDGPSGPVMLFGSMFLGETGLKFFRHLAKTLDIHHFVLSPSKVYRPDSAAKAQLPFLEYNGGLSAGFASLIPQLDAIVHQGEQEQAEETDSSLVLHRLRWSLYHDAPFDGDVVDDGSLTFLDAGSPRREVEILKDRIMTALKEDAGLAPTQIGVLAPDIGTYAPFIETVFPGLREDGRDALPYNLADLPSRDLAPYPAAFALLAELPGSRFGRVQMGQLFSNPCFAPLCGKSDVAEFWKELMDRAHVRWGTDEFQRQEEGAVDLKTGSWEMAFERLLSGYCFDEGDLTTLLPLNLAGDGEADIAGELMRTLRGLSADFQGLEKQRRSLRDWILYWEIRMERWLAPRKEGEGAEDDERDRLTAKASVRDLMALVDDLANLNDFEDDTLPWPAFRSMLLETAGKASGKRGRYLARGVTCSSLKPMRAIPFRRIYVLGMSEGAWPGREFLTGFDLRDLVPKSIDLSRESVDRFAILEILFSAQEHLSLSYCGRDVERGEAVAPASPVLELMDHLGEDAQRLIHRHPLAPFDSQALTGEGPLATISQEAASMAQSRSLHFPQSAQALPLDDPEIEELDWQELVAFLRNPLRHFYKGMLHAPLWEEEVDEGEEDVLEANPFDWWLWRRAHSEGDLSEFLHHEQMIESFAQQLDLDGAVAQTPARLLQQRRFAQDAQATAQCLEQMVGEGLDIVRTHRVGLRRWGDDSPALDGEIPVSAPVVEMADGRKIRVVGSIDGFRRLHGKDWARVDFVSGKKASTRHNIPSWVAVLVAAVALGEEKPQTVQTLRLGPHNIGPRTYVLPGGTAAGATVLARPQETLQHLVEAYFAGSVCPLPLYPDFAEGMAAALTKAKKAGVEWDFAVQGARLWERLVTDRYNPFSTLRVCPYRRNFYGTPSFDDVLERSWEQVYVQGGLL